MSEKHELQIPDSAGKGLTEWIAVCSCGARWRCYYTQKGLVRKAINDKVNDCPHN